MSRRLGTLLAGLALALGLAACGGGDGEAEAPARPEATAATTLSKQELLAQGDAICAEVNAAVGTVGSTGADDGGQASQVAELYTGMVERLEGLGRPSDGGGGYEAFIGAAKELAQSEKDAALAAERGEDGALATAETESSSALESFRSAATAYGFSQCGEAPAAPSTPPPSPEGESSAGEAEAEAPAVAPEEEYVPEVEEEVEVAPETGGAGSEEESPGGGAAAGGGEEGSSGGSGGGSGGIGPG